MRPALAESALACSASVRVSPRSVHAPNARNAKPATSEIQAVGSAAPAQYPMATDAACTTAVATVIPIRTGQGLNRVANVMAMSCDLSPSSATKITPKLTASAATNPCIGTLPAPGAGTGRSYRQPWPTRAGRASRRHR